jgi:hypothetical protein
MKTGYLAVLSLVMATSALAGPKKSADGVDFECAVTGSDKTGFSIYATNTTKVKKTCSATCKLIKKDGKTQNYEAKSRPVNGAQEGKDRSQRFEIEGQVLPKDGPFSSPDITAASCS